MGVKDLKKYHFMFASYFMLFATYLEGGGGVELNSIIKARPHINWIS